MLDPIVIATANPHKVEELRAIFALADIPVVGLTDLEGHEHFYEPLEHGTTCEQNARIKAAAYSRQTGHPCLADDSGIEIDALALPDLTPRPGVISSHYSTDGAETGLSRAQRDAANNALILAQLANVPAEKRTARFVCCMALTDRTGRIVLESKGTFEGRIGIPPRVPAGSNGFGYDPLFLVAPDFSRTGAELSSDEKNAQSHRAKAAAQMLERFRALRR